VGTLGWDPPAPFWRKHGWKVALGLLAVLVLAAFLVPPVWAYYFPPQPFYPLEVRNRWTYERYDGEVFTMEVTEAKRVEGGRRIVLVERQKGKEGRFTQVVEEREDGVFAVEINGKRLAEEVCVLKYPIKRGSRWTMPAWPEMGRKEAGVAGVVDTEAKAKVPYGEMTAVQAEALQGEWRYTAYYVRGVGPVRFVWTNDKKKLLGFMNLIKFERGE
jgi:hypothetical protein